MDRSTIVTLARASGGRLWYSKNDVVIFEFRTDDAVQSFREQLPFHASWSSNPVTPGYSPPIAVFLDQIYVRTPTCPRCAERDAQVND